jgi:hypothetical protein
LQIFESLAELDTDSLTWRSDIMAMVEKQGPPALSDVRRYQLAWSPAEQTEKYARSHETPTHYKIRLYGRPDDGLVVWLHKYKDGFQRGTGYSQIPHDHRYDFCSLMLAGSFLSRSYEIGAPMRMVGEARIQAGDWLSLEHTEIHALADIAEGTHTLVIQGPILRHHSTGYDQLTGNGTQFPDFAELHRRLSTELDAAS